MDRYEVMAGKMAPLTDGAHRKWGFTGKVETRSYERLVDALIDFVETGDSLTYKLVDAADHIGYEWTGRAHGSLADALATLAVQRWLEQWLVAE